MAAGTPSLGLRLGPPPVAPPVVPSLDRRLDDPGAAPPGSGRGVPAHMLEGFERREALMGGRAVVKITPRSEIPIGPHQPTKLHRCRLAFEPKNNHC